MTTDSQDTQNGLANDRKLLTDDEFLREVERDFSQTNSADDAQQPQRRQRVWQAIEAGLENQQDGQQAASQQRRPFSLGARTAVAAVIMVASAVLAGVVILSTLRSTDQQPFAPKGSAGGRTLDLKVTPTQEQGLTITSPGEGWLVVFVRNGETILPWVDGQRLTAGTTTLRVSDQPLPTGILWPRTGQDRRLYNVCALAVTQRPHLNALTADIATLWPSLSSSSCLF